MDAVRVAVLAGDLRPRRRAQGAHRRASRHRAGPRHLAAGDHGHRADPARGVRVRYRGALREAHRQAQASRLMNGGTSMQTDAAAPAAGIPGLVIRPYAGEADIPEIVRLTNADLAADAVREHFGVDELTSQFRRASDAFDPMRDILMAESDGVVIGTVRIDWVDTTDGKREFRSRGAVDPAWRRRGIGRRLLSAAADLMRERLAERPTERPVAVGMFIDEKQAAREAL